LSKRKVLSARENEAEEAKKRKKEEQMQKFLNKIK
jgi:hypothetical protein